jgi:hypothetical protein
MLDDVMEDDELSEEADEQLDRGKQIIYRRTLLYSKLTSQRVEIFLRIALPTNASSNGRNTERRQGSADYRRGPANRYGDHSRGSRRQRCRRHGGSLGQAQSLALLLLLLLLLFEWWQYCVVYVERTCATMYKSNSIETKKICFLREIYCTGTTAPFDQMPLTSTPRFTTSSLVAAAAAANLGKFCVDNERLLRLFAKSHRTRQ